jgi:hypothetical protein
MRYGRLMAMGIVFAGFLFAQVALAQQKTAQPQNWINERNRIRKRNNASSCFNR